MVAASFASTSSSNTTTGSGASSISLLAPPPTSLVAPISAWSSLSDSLDDDDVAASHRKRLSQFRPLSKASAASSSIQDARREIIASLSIAPRDDDDGDDAGESRNTFARYAQLERQQAQSRATATTQRRGVSQHSQSAAASAPPSPTSDRKKSSPLQDGSRRRAKSVEEALTHLGWFWNSDCESDLPLAPPTNATDDDDYLDKYATGQFDLEHVQPSPGYSCPVLGMPAPLPPHEEARKRMICRTGVFGLPAEIIERLHGIAMHVRGALNMTIFMLDILFGEEGWEITEEGVQHHNNYRRETICAHTILNAHRGMTILDLRADWRFQGNGILSPINFYSGFPVLSSSGLPLGALCVMDVNAQESFPDEHKGLLKLAAEQVSYIIETHFANTFLSKMNRLSSTYEHVTMQLLNIPQRALPRLDPSTFVLHKPLNASEGLSTLRAGVSPPFALHRCCQRIAAATDLDAVYIVAVDAPATHVIARSSNICPQNPPGAYFQQAIALARDDVEGCVIYQNALDGTTVPPIPAPEGNATDTRFTCAFMLPLLVKSRPNREDVAITPRCVSPPAHKTHFVLVAASTQPRHVLGIEDLRFLQGLQPHLLQVLQRCVTPVACASGIASPPAMTRQRSGHSARRSPQAVAPSLSPKATFAALPPASHSSSPSPLTSPSTSPSASFGGQRFRTTLPTPGAGDAVSGYDGSFAIVNSPSDVALASAASSSSSTLPSETPFSPPLSSINSLPMPPSAGRRGSGATGATSALSRIGAPLKLSQAAGTLRNTLGFQNKKSANFQSRNSTTRGSADSSFSRPGGHGHATSPSISTTEPSVDAQNSVDTAARQSSTPTVSPPSNAVPHNVWGWSLADRQIATASSTSLLSSASTSTLTPTPTPTSADQGQGRNVPHGKSKSHRSLLAAKLRRPMSAKGNDRDENGPRDMDGSTRFNDATSDSPRPVPSPRRKRSSAGFPVDRDDALRSPRFLPQCARCSQPIRDTADVSATVGSPRLGSSPRRPRTGGEHSRSNDAMLPSCTCIIPTTTTTTTTSATASPTLERFDAASLQFNLSDLDLSLFDADEVQELMLVDSRTHDGAGRGGGGGGGRSPLRSLSIGQLSAQRKGNFGKSLDRKSSSRLADSTTTVPPKTMVPLSSSSRSVAAATPSSPSLSTSYLALDGDSESDLSASAGSGSGSANATSQSTSTSTSARSAPVGLAPRPPGTRPAAHTRNEA